MAVSRCNFDVQRSPDCIYVPYLFSSVKRQQMIETIDFPVIRTIFVPYTFFFDSLRMSNRIPVVPVGDRGCCLEIPSDG
jgi:hypothetical protein